MYSVKCTKALEAIPLFHDEYVNLTISQEQLQLSIMYSKFFRKVVLGIYSCKGEFQNSYFLQRPALLEYLVYP